MAMAELDPAPPRKAVCCACHIEKLFTKSWKGLDPLTCIFALGTVHRAQEFTQQYRMAGFEVDVAEKSAENVLICSSCTASLIASKREAKLISKSPSLVLQGPRSKNHLASGWWLESGRWSNSFKITVGARRLVSMIRCILRMPCLTTVADALISD